MVTPTENGVHL